MHFKCTLKVELYKHSMSNTTRPTSVDILASCNALITPAPSDEDDTITIPATDGITAIPAILSTDVGTLPEGHSCLVFLSFISGIPAIPAILSTDVVHYLKALLSGIPAIPPILSTDVVHYLKALLSGFLSFIPGITAIPAILSSDVTEVPSGNVPHLLDKIAGIAVNPGIKDKNQTGSAFRNGVERGGGDTASISSKTTSTILLKYQRLDIVEIKDILVCFLYVIKHLPDDILLGWFNNSSEYDIIDFFSLLELCMKNFRYHGRKKIHDLSVIGDSRKALTMPAGRRSMPASLGMGSRTLSQCSDIFTDSPSVAVSSSSDGAGVMRALQEANMSTEVGLVVLDILCLYSSTFKKTLEHKDGDNTLMRKVFDLQLQFLQTSQSEHLQSHVFAAWRSFIRKYVTEDGCVFCDKIKTAASSFSFQNFHENSKWLMIIIFIYHFIYSHFPSALFKGNASLCGSLCYESKLLKCCNSKLTSTRKSACALLYLLMRSNFEFAKKKGFTRVHLQITVLVLTILVFFPPFVIISVSQLIGDVVGLSNSRFQESLAMINSYASSDKAMQEETTDFYVARRFFGGAKVEMRTKLTGLYRYNNSLVNNADFNTSCCKVFSHCISHLRNMGNIWCIRTVSSGELAGCCNVYNHVDVYDVITVNRGKSGFPAEVKDLTKKIRTVLMATSQMKEHENDPEMLIDLQYSLAKSYASTPELRKTWLDSMAKIHNRYGNYSEAAHCYIHIAALVAEYLKRRGKKKTSKLHLGKFCYISGSLLQHVNHFVDVESTQT
ncbi:hypothetical protein KUTeg_011943 [Tegillarca granosa]|uniref:DOCKER domain-containing protein n=1 Tax=Tegillarca granosa TaxID=220873 RepID=A0ABQ9F3D5_TEGGR|nr:hypothetical protein KUTeg_011943 [Tegillarca granosa]